MFASLPWSCRTKQKIIITSNFDDLDPDSEFAKLIAQEGFLSQYCVPIVIGGKSFGVLELFQRKPFSPTPEWLNLLDAIALQMGLALDYNNLYGELQNTYLDLADSYEATLEGWSSAMDVETMKPKAIPSELQNWRALWPGKWAYPTTKSKI